MDNYDSFTYVFKFFFLSQAIEKEGTVVEALRARRLVILDNIRDNDEAGVNYQKVKSLLVLRLIKFANFVGSSPYHQLYFFVGN